MSAQILQLSDYRKPSRVPMDIFGPLELVALSNLAVFFAFIAVCRILAEGPRADASRQ